MHVSPDVQPLPSLQIVPFDAVGFEQAPVPGSHVPATWHWSLAEQTFAVPPEQAPLWQLSPFVHALPSLQPVPFDAAGFEQLPLPGSHVPATWHWSSAVQTFVVPPVQAPLWQLSPFVHALLSSQSVPFVAAGFEQRPVPGSHAPATWH